MSDRFMAIEFLKQARELIRDRNRWTTTALARDAQGEAVDPFDDNAVCWCATGALAKVCSGTISTHAEQSRVLDAVYDEDVYGFLEKSVRPGVNLAWDALRRASAEEYKRFPSQITPESVNNELGHEAVLGMYDDAISLVGLLP